MPTVTGTTTETISLADGSSAFVSLPEVYYPPVPPPRPQARLARVTRHTQEDYAHSLSHLLPWGIGWPRWFDSVLMRVVTGLSGIVSYAEGRLADILERESYILTTIEMLSDWERVLGLPDPCYTGPSTIGERQRALAIRMLTPWAPYNEYSQSREWYIALAAFLGYEVTISEYRPFMVGIDRAGDNRKIVGGVFTEKPCQIGAPDRLRFAWTMHVHRVRLTWFRASRGQAGIDPHLRIAIAQDLECVIRRWRPAHTEILFDYSGLTPPDHFAGTP